MVVVDSRETRINSQEALILMPAEARYFGGRIDPSPIRQIDGNGIGDDRKAEMEWQGPMHNDARPRQGRALVDAPLLAHPVLYA